MKHEDLGSGRVSANDTEVLLAAADLIERNGLHKGDYWPGAADGNPYEPGEPCCVFGALRVLTGASYNHDLVMKIRRAIKRHIVGWSDSHSQAQVVETLRAVATAEET